MKPLITPLATLSYPWLDKAQPAKIDPKTGQPKGQPKFSSALVFANADDIAALKAAAIEVAIDKFGATKGPKMVTVGGKGSTFRNDVEGKYPEGSVYLSARADTQPGLVYKHADPETKKAAKVAQADIQKVFYPGAKVLGLVVPFAYDHPENKGVSFALVGVQKIDEGERLDNRVAAEDAFSAEMNEVPAELEGLV
jgi:hypothetical protein